MAAQPTHFSALGRALVQQGRLVQADANAIQSEASKAGITFIQQLVASKKLSAKEVSLFAAQTFGYPLLDLNAVDFDHLPLTLIDTKIIANHRVIALGKRGNRVFVAMSDPSNEQVLQEVKFATGMTMEPVVVEDDKLTAIVKKLTDSSAKTLEQATEDVDLSGIEMTDGEAQPDIVTEDIELWYTGAAANRGWILTMEENTGPVYLYAPYGPHHGGAQRWKLQITYEPK